MDAVRQLVLLAVMLLALGSLPQGSLASHFRGGWIEYEVMDDGLTVEFKVVASWKASLNWTPYAKFSFGDGNSQSLKFNPSRSDVTQLYADSDYKMIQVDLVYRYSVPGVYRVGYSDCCRLGTLWNSKNSNYKMYSGFELAPGLKSPAVSVPAILQVPVNTVNRIPLTGLAQTGPDPECQAVSEGESGIRSVPQTSIGTKPVAMLPSPCTLEWDTTHGKSGTLYAYQFRYQAPGSPNYMSVDFVMKLVSGPPICGFSDGGNGQYVLEMGDALTFGVDVNTETPGELVTMSTLPSPLKLGMSVSPGPGSSSSTPVKYNFSYVPQPGDEGLSYALNMIFTDSRGVQCTVSPSIAVRELNPPPPPNPSPPLPPSPPSPPPPMPPLPPSPPALPPPPPPPSPPPSPPPPSPPSPPPSSPAPLSPPPPPSPSPPPSPPPPSPPSLPPPPPCNGVCPPPPLSPPPPQPQSPPPPSPPPSSPPPPLPPSPPPPSPPPPSPPPSFDVPDVPAVVREGGQTFSYTIKIGGALPATMRVALHEYSTEQLQIVSAGGEAPGDGASSIDVSVNDPAGLTVVIAAVDDILVEGNHSGIVEHAWLFGGTVFELDSVSVAIIDNDEPSAGLQLVPGANIVIKEGTTDTFGVVLSAPADQQVVVNIPVLTSSRLSMGLDPLSFSSLDYNIPQNITLNAPYDGIATGNITFEVTLSSTSLTKAYNGLEAKATITVIDEDMPEITTNIRSLVVDEAEVVAVPQLEVSLASIPTAPVTISLQDDSGQLELSATVLTFSPREKPTPRMVTVNAVHDLIAEPDRDVVLNLVTVSFDPVYSGMVIPINVKVLDDDAPGVIVDPMQLTVPEKGIISLSVTLSSFPVEPVVVTFASEVGGFQPTSLLFHARDWNLRQTKKVVEQAVAHDRIVTGDYSMAISVTVSGDNPTYLALGSLPDVQVTVKDIDVPRLCVESCKTDGGAGPFVLATAAQEGGAPVALELVLSTRPSADVQLVISTYDSSQIEPADSTTSSWLPLTIEPARHSVGSTYLLQAIDDQVPEGDHDTQICVETTSTDAFYNGLQRCVLLNIKDSILVKVSEDIGTDGGVLEGYTGVEVDFPPGAIQNDPNEPITLQQVDPDFQQCPIDYNRYQPVSIYNLAYEDEFAEEVTVSIPLPDAIAAASNLMGSNGTASAAEYPLANYHIMYLIEETCEWQVFPKPTVIESGMATTSVTRLPPTWGLMFVKLKINLVEPEEPQKIVFVEGQEPVRFALNIDLEPTPAMQTVDELFVEVIKLSITNGTFASGEDVLLVGDMDHEEYSQGEQMGGGEMIAGEDEETPSGSQRRRLAHANSPVRRSWSNWDFDWDETNGVLTLSTKDQPASHEEAKELLGSVSYYNPRMDLRDRLNRIVTLHIYDSLTVTPRAKWLEVNVQPVPTPPEVRMTPYPLRCVERTGSIAIDDNMTITDADSKDLFGAWIALTPVVTGDVMEYNETPGVQVAKTSPGQWQATGLASIETYQTLLRSFRIRNDGPTVRDGNGGYSRRVWFYVEDENQAWGYRDIEMVPVNDPPIITAPLSFAILEEQAKSGFLEAYDPEGEDVEYSIGCQPSKGTLKVDVATGEYEYRPYLDEQGDDSFVFVASDPQGLTDMQTVKITIQNLPDPPKADDLTVSVWMGVNNIITLPIYDPDGDELHAFITTEPLVPGHQLYLQDEFRSQAGSSRRAGGNPVVYNPPVRAVSGYLDSFQFAGVSVDGAGISQIRTCTLVVQNPDIIDNQPPEAENMTVVVASGQTVSGNLKAIDDTTEGKHLVYELTSRSRIGAISHSSGAGSTNFSYTGYPATHGNETILYTATDIFGATSVEAVITVVVQKVNAPPRPACMESSTLFLHGLQDLLLGGSDAEASGLAATDANVAEVYASRLALELRGFPSSDVRIATLQAMNETLFSRLQFQGNATDGPKLPALVPQLLCESSSTLSLEMTRDAQQAPSELLLFAYDVDEEEPLRYRVVTPPMHGAISFGEEASTSSTMADGDAAALAGGAGQPLPLFYKPDPLRRGFPMDSFQWVAEDSMGLVSETIMTSVEVACAPGHVMVSETKCRPCAKGQYNLPDILDQTQCFQCPKGTSAPFPGSTSCTTCPANTYADKPGTGTCKACPDPAMRSPPGSSDATACRCTLGHFVNVHTTPETCLPCPPNSTVCDEVHQRIPKPVSEEWWVDPEDGDVLPCIPRLDSCLHHKTVSETLLAECQDGYHGFGCRYCDSGFFRKYDTLCTKCSRFTWFLYVVSVVALLFAVPILSWLVRLHIWAALNILLVHLQTNAMLISMNLNWPEALKVLYAFITAAIVKFDVFSPQCFFPKSSYLLKLIIVNTLPVFLLLSFALYAYYRRWREERKKTEASKFMQYTWCTAPMAGYLAMLSVAYTTIADVNLEYWNCKHSHDGLYFMVASPNIQCWNYSEPNLHTKLLPMVIICILVYLIGIPLLFLWLLMRNRTALKNRKELEIIMLYGEGTSGSMSAYTDMAAKEEAGGDAALLALVRAKEQFGFLFRRYEPGRYWWELVVLLKKLSIAIVHHNLPPASIEQGASTCLVIVTYGLAVARFGPYDNNYLDAMDYIAETMSILFVIAGMAFFTDVQPPQEQDAIAGVLVILSLASFAIMGAFVVYDAFPRIRMKIRRWRIDRNAEKHKMRLELEERSENRRARWRSMAKRVPKSTLGGLVDAAQETQAIEDAQAARKSSKRSKKKTKGPSRFSLGSEGNRQGDVEIEAHPPGMMPDSNEEESIDKLESGPSSSPSQMSSRSEAEQWVDKPMHNRDVAPGGMSLFGKMMQPLWKRELAAELEAEKKELYDSKSAAEIAQVSRGRDASEVASWKRVLMTVALGGASPQRSRIIKLFSAALSHEELEFVKDWTMSQKRDDGDLRAAEQLGMLLFKIVGIERSARMDKRRHKGFMAPLDYDDDDRQTSLLFRQQPEDRDDCKAQEYVAFEGNEVLRALLSNVTSMAKGQKKQGMLDAAVVKQDMLDAVTMAAAAKKNQVQSSTNHTDHSPQEAEPSTSNCEHQPGASSIDEAPAGLREPSDSNHNFGADTSARDVGIGSAQETADLAAAAAAIISDFEVSPVDDRHTRMNKLPPIEGRCGQTDGLAATAERKSAEAVEELPDLSEYSEEDKQKIITMQAQSRGYITRKHMKEKQEAAAAGSSAPAVEELPDLSQYSEEDKQKIIAMQAQSRGFITRKHMKEKQGSADSAPADAAAANDTS